MREVNTAAYIERAITTREKILAQPNFGASRESRLHDVHWGVGPVGRHRDSTLLETSNWEVVTGDLLKRFPDDVEIEEYGHWGVGWIEELHVRLTDSEFKPTEAAQAAAEWAAKLADYPCADEEDYARREWEATMENVASQVHYMTNNHTMTKRGERTKQETIAYRVAQWLDESEQRELESRDDQGGYPSNEATLRALRDLGYVFKKEPE